MAEEITQRQDLIKKIRDQNRPSILLVHMKQCGHCVKYRPQYEKIAKKYRDTGLKFFEMEKSVVSSSDLNKMDVKSYPTTLFIGSDFKTEDDLKIVGNRPADLENNISIFLSKN